MVTPRATPSAASTHNTTISVICTVVRAEVVTLSVRTYAVVSP